MEGIRVRWRGRASNPVGGGSRSRVSSTLTAFRHTIRRSGGSGTKHRRRSQHFELVLNLRRRSAPDLPFKHLYGWLIPGIKETSVSVNVSRRSFLKLGAAGLGASSMAMMGFAPDEAVASVRHFKLSGSTVSRNICTYCSVGCGMLLYSRGDGAINVIDQIYHVEGDPDHPVSRGSLCPRGAGVLDFINSESRVKYPEVRDPYSNEWRRISWDEALDRIARLMKDDRDANFETHDEQGRLVNRWMTTSMVAASATTNETAYITQKVTRALGILKLDNQARV